MEEGRNKEEERRVKEKEKKIYYVLRLSLLTRKYFLISFFQQSFHSCLRNKMY